MSDANIESVDRIELSAGMRRQLGLMKQATQAVAIETFGLKMRDARTVLLSRYEIGKLVGPALRDENEEIYGTDAIQQISTFIGIQVPELKSLANLADRVTLEEIQTYINEPMRNGTYLNLTHWIALAQVADKDRPKLITRVLKESWSTNDLIAFIRSGNANRTSNGRRPSPPKNVLVGVQKYYALLLKTSNYDKLLDEHVFSHLDEVKDDEAAVAKLKDVLSLMDKQAEAIQQNREKLESFLSQRLGVTVSSGDDKPAAKPSSKKTAKKTVGHKPVPKKPGGKKPGGKKPGGKKPGGKKPGGKKPVEELQPA